jgi:hypothetical protein
MPLLQYFGWVGSFLLTALFAANWCLSAPIAPAPETHVALDHKINIRIHTDRKWPELVVFDTNGPTLAQKPDAETAVLASEPPVVEERRAFEAFAEMIANPVKPCFRTPCSAGEAAERKALRVPEDASSHTRSRVAAHGDLTSPNRLHKPPGKS